LCEEEEVVVDVDFDLMWSFDTTGEAGFIGIMRGA